MIGWYVHHHGSGHMQRLRTVRPGLRSQVVAFSSTTAPDVVTLPSDVASSRLPADHRADAQTETAVGFHYAPLGIAAIGRRMAMMTDWARDHAPALFVVDVSVEVATLMRLHSIPTVVVRQNGHRNDSPHVQCYANASLLLAPFPAWMDDEWTPDWLRDKTVYSGGFSRFDQRMRGGSAPDRAVARMRLGLEPDLQLVVVMIGRGGREDWSVTDAAAATPDWSWVVLGSDEGPGVGDLGVGWVEDPLTWLRAADVVVTHAGHNAVMECAAVDRPTVVVPVDRPFDEQFAKVRALQRAEVMTVCRRWPQPEAWNGVLDVARERGTTEYQTMVDGDGATRAAGIIDGAADRFGADHVVLRRMGGLG